MKLRTPRSATTVARKALPTLKQYLHLVEHACIERGLRMTLLRSQVLSLIVASNNPIKAYELVDAMTLKHGITAPISVYRALSFLVDHGFIHRITSMNAFIGCQHPETQHSVPFLICEHCHTTFEVDDSKIVDQLEILAKRQGFLPRTQTLEVIGLCSDCGRQP